MSKSGPSQELMETKEKKPEKREQKFGTIKGVYIPSVLTILGVILYLRMGWVLGNVGLIQTYLIVAMATAITFLTGLSISATATNMKIGRGGAYYMISRSFGIEAGASVGLPLYIAQALGISFYLIGFAESLQTLLPNIETTTIAAGALVVLTILAYLSADLALKTQLLILTVIIFSIISFLLGSNPIEGYREVPAGPPVSFWLVFAVFFPAVTGIEAGVSLSGDLKNPSKSLPRGTLAAVATGLLVYLALPTFMWNNIPQDILRSNPMVMKEYAMFGWAIYLGLWGATLSSALGALLGGPRTLQALAQDRVVFRFLGKGFRGSSSPHIATAFTFLVALGGISLGAIEVIAPVLSMFFLTSYGALNLIAGIEGLIGNPSWRPTFRTPWSVSLIGAFGCFATMLMIDAGSAFTAFFATIIIYTFMRKRKMNTRWSDIRRGMLSFLARSSIYRLANFELDTRSWRPHIVVLSGSPTSRWYLIELADAITHGKGFLTVASVFSKPDYTAKKIQSIQQSIKQFLRKRNVPALVKVKNSPELNEAIIGLVKDYGLGPLVPNTFMFGETEKEENFTNFSRLIKTIHSANRNLVVIRQGNQKKSEEEDPSEITQKKRIEVWWGRQQNNAGLMLTLAYMLQTSPEWSGSELVLKSLVKTEGERQGVLENLQKLVGEGRIPAEVEVLVGSPNEPSLQTIARYSRGADLVFIGMKPCSEDESPEEYAGYYETLIKGTETFPLTAIVLSGEDISFKEIFN